MVWEVIVLSSPTLLERRFGWLPEVTAMPIWFSTSVAETALEPRAWLLAGRGESPVQSPKAGALVGVHNLLGVVALLGRVCPSGCTESRWFVSADSRMIKSSGSSTIE
jgi:hypothetical protein